MKNIFILVFILLSSISSFAEKIVSLPDVLKPHSMAVDSHQLYICEGPVISIYSLEDFRLIRKFGRKGEGPLEFKGSARVKCRTDHLIVQSSGKVALFKKNGDLIKEMKALNPFYGDFEPLHDQYVATEYDFRENQRIILFNSNLEKINDIYQAKIPKKRGEIFDTPFLVHTSEDKIFIAANKEFIIEVFDIKLKKLFSIERDYQLIEITKAYIEDFFESYRTSPVTKSFYNGFKKIAKFPSHFPAIRNFIIEDGKIYVFTYKTIDNSTEFFIFNEDGGFVKSVFLPVIDKEIMSPAIFRIKNGNLYHLVENEESDEWELRISAVN